MVPTTSDSVMKPFILNEPFLLETAMFRVKNLSGGILSLRDCNVQISETYSIAKVLNKLTGLGMPKIQALFKS
ncbi:Mobile element protein [Candidatus Enterovibrio altilux]|uniref:Mobile element protein n=1 Tax=Candidatus Enterovibrio altilux TaxID=1927128 RepID=A0A291B8W2_9GAMM|nr:Mobile element protein [Candidatus Enterovibrio luxaltus]